MKILYHHRTLGDGAEGIHIREMVGALRELGHEVCVVSLIGECTSVTTTRRKWWEMLSRLMPLGIYELAELSYNVVGALKLLQAINKFKPDFIYDRYNSYCTAALRAARRARLPILLEVNAPVAYERTAYENLQLKLPWLARRYEKMICSSVDHVFVVSTPLREYLVQELRVPKEKVSILPNGANPRAFHPSIDGSSIRRRYCIEDLTVIGFVGILRPWHGVDMLIDAFAQLRMNFPALHLLIAGDGPIKKQLEAHARKRGVGSNVTFTGRISHEDVGTYISAMDITVSPNATFYASPIKILEYMAMSKAVVAPDLPNIRDLIQHDQDGLLFKPESVESLSDEIDKLLKSPEQRISIGQAARRKVETRLNWQQNARRVLDVGSLIVGR